MSIAHWRLYLKLGQTNRIKQPPSVRHSVLARHGTLRKLTKMQAISRGLFADSSVESLELAGNIMDKTDLMRMEGVDAFLARREKNKNKNLQGGGMLTLSVCGLD